MTLDEFLNDFSMYKAEVTDSFENLWRVYKNEHGCKGMTYIIKFENQNLNDVNCSLTFVNQKLVQGDVGFHDYQIIYVDPEYKTGYLNCCTEHYVDADGTKNVYEMGDYIPNKYVDLDEFLNAITFYADAIWTGKIPYYEEVPVVEVPQEYEVGDLSNAQSFEEHYEQALKKYTVKFTVEVEIEAKAINMDAAHMVAASDLHDELCYFFDNDQAKVVKRAVIETVNGETL